MSAHALRSSCSFDLMNWRMSGWSMLRMTIFAARRVLPPLLMTPANESKRFMKDTGPDAVPPPARISFEERIDDRFEPAPEPYLKSMPSVFARSRMELIESPTELMKHAEHCGSFSTPTLNQTGELKAMCWWRRIHVSSAWKVFAAFSSTSREPEIGRASCRESAWSWGETGR